MAFPLERHSLWHKVTGSKPALNRNKCDADVVQDRFRDGFRSRGEGEEPTLARDHEKHCQRSQA